MNKAARAAASMMFAVGLGMAAAGAVLAQDNVKITHGHSLFGDLKYGPDFKHFDYVNPNAPKGGRVKMAALGTFDSLNGNILKGVTAYGLGLIGESLMQSSRDEAFTEYCLLAASIEVPDDRSWALFTMRP